MFYNGNTIFYDVFDSTGHIILWLFKTQLFYGLINPLFVTETNKISIDLTREKSTKNERSLKFDKINKSTRSCPGNITTWITADVISTLT